MIDLYDYQGIAVNDMQAVYAADYCAPLLALPTGRDKTVGFIRWMLGR